jgi:hypothetical protein
METLPDFNDAGDLPAGVYQASVSLVIQRLGSGTLQRRVLARRLEHIFRLAVSTGFLARFIVFGSFVTNKSEPNDVDIFMLMDDDFDVSRTTGEVALIFNHISAQNYEGASIFWIRRLAALGGEQAVIEHWQIKRDGNKRGIIEVIGDDQ